jgi:hypothetical protein
MPNRKTFDEREKYDHSGRPLDHRQENDLQADVNETPDARRGSSTARTSARRSRPVAGRMKIRHD